MRKNCLSIIVLWAVAAVAQPTAREWNAAVRAGWNLGNQMECPAPGQNNEGYDITNPANALRAVCPSLTTRPTPWVMLRGTGRVVSLRAGSQDCCY